MFRIKDAPTVVVILALLQVLSTTYFLYIPNFYVVNSFLFLFSGIYMSIALLKIPQFQIRDAAIINSQLVSKFFIIALLVPVSYLFARHIMDDNPLHYQNADMLPIIKIMNKRFLDGHIDKVYQPIPEIWNGITPIYLPAMWMPFGFSLIFDFDIRWITVCGIWLSIILCVWPNWKRKWQSIALVAAILTLVIWFHTDDDNGVIELTEEGIVFFYYAFLITAIILNNPWLLGISVALCLLSRYSFIGWIPFAVLYLLLKREYKFLLKTSLTAFIILLILLFPFGIGPLFYHLHLHDDYIAHATRVWNDEPETFYETLGMAKFFGHAHIKLLHAILEAGAFLVPLLFLFFVRKKNSAQPNILLAGLQLSLTFFYNFLDVPYMYLFYTLVFINLVIAGWVLSIPRTASN